MSAPVPWLLLRGFIREQAHWLGFPEQFERALQAPVHLLDLPGAGDLRHLQVPLQISAMTDLLRLERERRALPRSFRVLALSLGGMVAMDWAARFPSEIERLVVVNSSLQGLSPFYRRLRWKILGEFLGAAMARGASARERRVLQMVSQNLEARQRAEPTWARIREERPISVAQTLRQLFAARRARVRAEKLLQPLLWLQSGGDRLVHSSCTLDLHRYFGGKLVTHPWAGHDLTLDDPDWVIHQIRRWLGE